MPWCYYSTSHGYQMEGDLVKTNAGKPDNEAGAPDPLFAAEESLSGLQSVTLHSHTTTCDRRWALLLGEC